MRNLQGKGLLGLFLFFLPTCSSQTLSCCHGDVRLVNGYTPNEGRVEVCLSNQWNTICNRFWDAIDAGVVCVQLGFRRQNAQVVTLTNGSFGSGSGSIVGNVSCRGTEMALTECTLNHNHYGYCTHSYDAGLRCATMCQTGALRLQGGSRHGEGRVEVCINGTWVTVCGDYWDLQAAKVVCRQLGFSSLNAQVHRQASHGAGSGRIHLMCSGNESSLLDCSDITHFSYCSHYEDASVTCQANLICQNGNVRLVNGASYSGRVEICLNETWGTICDDGWQNQSANVTCRQLGYSGYRNWNNRNIYGRAAGDIHLTSVNCRGNEESLLECSYSQNTQSCLHSTDVAVECITTRKQSVPSGEVRLTGGLTQYEGVVKISLNGTWQHICFDGWNEPNARVVCRQLGYLSTSTNATAYRVEIDTTKHSNKTQIVLTNVTCIGTESQLTSCCATKTHLLYCSSQMYAGVRCGQCPEESLRLVNGSSQYNEGRLEICLGGGWGTICDDDFSINDAIVACRQLGFSTEGSTSRCCGSYGKGTTLPIAMVNVECRSTENKLSQCTYLNSHNHNCGHSEDVGVICQRFTLPGMPQSLSVQSTSPTEITLSWIKPLESSRSGTILTYTINCSSLKYRESESNQSYSLNVSSDTHENIFSVNPFETYNCCVSAINREGRGKSICKLVVTEPTEPTAAPMKVQGYSLNSTTIFLSWSPPPVEHQNGIIQRYYINVTSVISGNQETVTTIATHFLFQNLEPNSAYSFTVAAYTVALGPASEPTVVNTEQNCDKSSGSAVLEALTGVFAVIIIVLGIICICVLTYFYLKQKISDNIQCRHEDQSEVVDSNDDQISTNTTKCQLKFSPMPESMERTNSQVSLDRVTNSNSNFNSFEQLETKNKYSPDSPPPADEGNVYQPLSLQDSSEDATSNWYQSLTHSAKEFECATPGPPISSKASEYPNLPCSSKQPILSKQREFCYEDVVIKKRKS